MELIVLSIHLLVCLCLIGLVLLQRSEGGALGMGGGGGGSLMSGRGAADALARMTSVAGGFFLVTSLGLTILSGADNDQGRSVLDGFQAPITAPAIAPAPAPTEPTESRPDPTESSIPATTQLASVVGPPAAAASETPARAAPLDGSTAPRPAVTRPVQTAAVTTPARQPAPQRSPPATTTDGERALVLPNTSGSVSGISLSDAANQSESIDVGNGLEAVRRDQRAGPDQ